jgi:cell division protein FtsB
MTPARPRPAYGALLMMAASIIVGIYFALAAVQGEYGLFRQVQIAAEKEELMAVRDLLAAELAAMENLTRRLSDSYLDLDLLDQQARDVLGYVRADEVVIR